MPDAASCLLTVRNLVSGYGKREVVKGVSLDVASGSVMALIGHNGAGKTTLLRAIFGLIPIWAGEVILNGEVLDPSNPQQLLRRGVTYVPQGNRVFTDLTVDDNLKIAGGALSDEALLTAAIGRALSFFPILRARLRQRAGTLSGGEQQMLALSNAMILSPLLLLLDEPSLGLSPQLVAQALSRIKEISTQSGATVLIVEQKVREVLKIADHVCVLRNGRVSFSGRAADLIDEKRLREVYL